MQSIIYCKVLHFITKHKSIQTSLCPVGTEFIVCHRLQLLPKSYLYHVPVCNLILHMISDNPTTLLRFFQGYRIRLHHVKSLSTLFSTCRVIFQHLFSNPFSLWISGPRSLHIYTFLRVVHPHEYLFSSCTMAAFCIQSPITRLFTTLRHFISDDVICLRYLFLSAQNSEPCRFFSRVSLTVTVFL